MTEIRLESIKSQNGQLNTVSVNGEKYYAGHLTKEAREKLYKLLKLYDKNSDNKLSDLEQLNVETSKMEEILCNLNLARDLNTTLDALAILVKHPNEDIREAVVEHFRTTPDMLKNLVSDPSIKVQAAVAKNPKTPVSALITLSKKDKDEWVRGAVAENTNTPPKNLGDLAFDLKENVRYAAAGNYNTPSYALKILATENESHWIKEAIAKNANVTPEVLGILADPQYGGEKTRILVASNYKTPYDAVNRLSKDKSEKVRLALVNSKNGCVDRCLLEQMAYGDKDAAVRKAALKRLKAKAA